MENPTPEITEEADVRGAPDLSDNALTGRIIGAAIEVHRHLGPGLLESAYEECLCYELSQMGLHFERQVHLPINYKGIKLQCAHRMDLIVEDTVIVEIKATENVAPIHSSQLLTYLKFSQKRVGLLINFNVAILKSGLTRIVNHYLGPRISAPSVDSTGLPSSSASRLSPRLRVSASRRDPQ
ncbi:MAG TPA: GxxExxY protein [Bryobacteraceae bacterium]|jgi:GxxExxY protein